MPAGPGYPGRVWIHRQDRDIPDITAGLQKWMRLLTKFLKTTKRSSREGAYPTSHPHRHRFPNGGKNGSRKILIEGLKEWSSVEPAVPEDPRRSRRVSGLSWATRRQKIYELGTPRLGTEGCGVQKPAAGRIGVTILQQLGNERMCAVHQDAVLNQEPYV